MDIDDDDMMTPMMSSIIFIKKNQIIEYQENLCINSHYETLHTHFMTPNQHVNLKYRIPSGVRGETNSGRLIHVSPLLSDTPSACMHMHIYIHIDMIFQSFLGLRVTGGLYIGMEDLLRAM